MSPTIALMHRRRTGAEAPIMSGTAMIAPVNISDQTTRPQTVLVVEDEVLVRMTIADYLRDCGLRVLEAGSADEALTILRTDEPVHVLFTDVNMPGSVDGFGLAQWVRRERPELKVIITSGVTRTVNAAGDLCSDAPYLAKPYDLADVERRIRQLLANVSGEGAD